MPGPWTLWGVCLVPGPFRGMVMPGPRSLGVREICLVLGPFCGWICLVYTPQEGTPPRRYTPLVLTSSGGRRSGHILPDAFLLFNHFKFDKEAFKRNMQPVLFHNSNFEKRFIHSVEFIFQIWLTYSNAGVMTVIWF